MSVFCDQGDGYNLDFDSDDGISCSSESGDELETMIKGTPEQKRKILRKSQGKHSSDDESDFEKEMEMELNQTVQNLEMKRSSAQDKPGPSSAAKDSSTSSNQSKPPDYYDEMYFDSDSDDENDSKAPRNQRCARGKRPIISNDDLLYDPDQDDDNQRWVDQMRRNHRPTASSSNKTKVKPAPQSDAVLNCPACMITLCVDCQRHELYKNQYRAMFVINCNVNGSEVLRYPKENAKKKKKNNRKRKHDTEDEGETATSPAGLDEGAAYNPVKCSECTTEVAVMDSDEVYHFFNVLASYA